MLRPANPAKMLPAMIRTVSVFVVALLCALWGNAARAQMSDADIVTRMDRLEGAIRDLTGQVEQLQYRNQQLEQQLQQMQAGAPAAFGAGGTRHATAAATADGVVHAAGAAATATVQPQYPQYSPPTAAGAGRVRGRRRPRRAAAATLSTRRSIRPRPARRGARHQHRRQRTAAAGVRTPPRQAGAPLDLSAVLGPNSVPRAAPSGTPQNGDLPPPPPANPSATGAVGVVAADQFAEGRIRSRLRLSAAQGLCATPPTPSPTSCTSIRAIGLTPEAQYLARREPVPEPALSRRRRSLPRRLDQIREQRARARRAVAARHVARGARRKGSRLRLARRGVAQISARLAEREAWRRPGTEACPLLTQPSPPMKRARCFVVSNVCPVLCSPFPAVRIPPRSWCSPRVGRSASSAHRNFSPSPSITACAPRPRARRRR